MIYVKSGGVWRPVSTTTQVRVGGAWHPARAFVRVGGVWRNCSLALPAQSSLTPGIDDQSSPPFFTLQYFGYNNGAAGSFATMGSLSPTTFTDSAAQTRTIAVLASFFFQDDISTSSETFFWLSGSVPNTNDTFQRINISGSGDLVRTDASFAESGGYSKWTWPGAFIGSSPHTVRLLFDASQS